MARLNANIPDDLHDWFRAYASEQGRSMGDILVSLLNEIRFRPTPIMEAVFNDEPDFVVLLRVSRKDTEEL